MTVHAPVLDKDDVLAALRARLDDDLASAIAAQKAAHAGATHEEAKPENDKDTRGLEQSYLARGLAERVDTLRAAKSALLVRPPPMTTTAVGALVCVEDEDDGATRAYFIAEVAGGLSATVGDTSVTIVTPSSPLGRALVGSEAGDDVTAKTPKGKKSLVVTRVQ